MRISCFARNSTNVRASGCHPAAIRSFALVVDSGLCSSGPDSKHQSQSWGSDALWAKQSFRRELHYDHTLADLSIRSDKHRVLDLNFAFDMRDLLSAVFFCSCLLGGRENAAVEVKIFQVTQSNIKLQIWRRWNNTELFEAIGRTQKVLTDPCGQWRTRALQRIREENLKPPAGVCLRMCLRCVFKVCWLLPSLSSAAQRSVDHVKYYITVI